MNTPDLLDEIAKGKDHEIEAAAHFGLLMFRAAESPHEEIRALAEHWNAYEDNRHGYWTRRWSRLLQTVWEADEARKDPQPNEPHPSLTAEERNPGLTQKHVA